MRKLDDHFIKELKTGGLLNPIVETVINDTSLDFEIRGGYINIYFKGNSILKLNENATYEIHKKFLNGTGLTKNVFTIKSDVNDYLSALPSIKNNVINVKSKRPTLEIEYEQLLIRSNNLNKNVNSEIFITDRQYADNINNSRFDLSGFYWGSNNRKRGQTVPLTFIEVKYSLNQDIKEIDIQIGKYYNVVKNNISDIATEAEYLKNLKIELGLINQGNNRLDAMKTLKISDRIQDVKFIIALIDYNPNSKSFDMNKLKALPYSNQIDIFYGGLAIWDNYIQKL